jgi:hypothetical protein
MHGCLYKRASQIATRGRRTGSMKRIGYIIVMECGSFQSLCVSWKQSARRDLSCKLAARSEWPLLPPSAGNPPAGVDTHCISHGECGRPACFLCISHPPTAIITPASVANSNSSINGYNIRLLASPPLPRISPCSTSPPAPAPAPFGSRCSRSPCTALTCTARCVLGK